MATASITELRGLCQSLAIPFNFSDDKAALQQKIDLKAAKALERPEPPPTYIPEDARLRSRPPAKECTKEMLEEMLEQHVKRGLILTYNGPDQWHMRFGVKEDSGSMRMPPRVLMGVVTRLMS